MDKERPAWLGQAFLCQIFPTGHTALNAFPLWLLFHQSVCWLTQTIILTSGLHPNSLRDLVALILPLEASPSEFWATVIHQWALFGPLSPLSLFFSHKSYYWAWNHRPSQNLTVDTWLLFLKTPQNKDFIDKQLDINREQAKWFQIPFWEVLK